jgi:hypothetical protein
MFRFFCVILGFFCGILDRDAHGSFRDVCCDFSCDRVGISSIWSRALDAA